MYKIYKVSNKGKYGWCLDTRVTKKGVTTGRRHYFFTKKAAQDYLKTLIENNMLEQEQKPRTASIYIKDIYLDFAKNYVTKSKRRNKSDRNNADTIRDRIGRYNNYLKSYLSGVIIDDINTSFMTDLSDYICELDNAKGDQISGSLMYRIWSDFKAFIKYCVDKELIVKQVIIKDSDEIYAPIKNKKPECWTIKEFDIFMSKVDNETYECIFLVLAHAGLRKSEMRGLKCKNKT